MGGSETLAPVCNLQFRAVVEPLHFLRIGVDLGGVGFFVVGQQDAKASAGQLSRCATCISRQRLGREVPALKRGLSSFFHRVQSIHSNIKYVPTLAPKCINRWILCTQYLSRYLGFYSPCTVSARRLVPRIPSPERISIRHCQLKDLGHGFCISPSLLLKFSESGGILRSIRSGLAGYEVLTVHTRPCTCMSTRKADEPHQLSLACHLQLIQKAAKFIATRGERMFCQRRQSHARLGNVLIRPAKHLDDGAEMFFRDVYQMHYAPDVARDVKSYAPFIANYLPSV